MSSDAEEDTRSRVVRAVDRIPVPPSPSHFNASVPQENRVSPGSGFWFGAALVVAIAMTLAFAGSRSAVPAASGAIGITAGESSPVISASSSPRQVVLSDRFGFLIDDGSRATVRSETSSAAIQTLAQQGRSWTSLSHSVSPDGRYVAYWAPVRNGAALHVRSMVDGNDRGVFTAAPNMSGNAFAWSSDGAGLALAIDNDCQETCVAQGGKIVAELWTVNLSNGATTRIATGKFWIPVTWDRSADLIAAGVTGPGGYLTGYDIFDVHQVPATPRTTSFQQPVIGRLRSSSDSRYVLLTYFAQGGSGNQTAALAWWPLSQPERRTEVPFDGADAIWRPGTSEIWWLGGIGQSSCSTASCPRAQLLAFDVASNARKSLQGIIGTSILGFRVDGSAAITNADSNLTTLLVVDVRSGATERVQLASAFEAAVALP